MAAGESISYIFSLMVTPVRPFDLKERFRERWAQLGGPSNYSQLADAGVTVVNMHQGNEINVRDQRLASAFACWSISGVVLGCFS